MRYEWLAGIFPHAEELTVQCNSNEIADEMRQSLESAFPAIRILSVDVWYEARSVADYAARHYDRWELENR